MKCHWQLGKVIKQIKGKDDVAIAVRIQIMSQGKPSETERPLQETSPLEIDEILMNQ